MLIVNDRLYVLKGKIKENAFSDDLNSSKNKNWMKEITEIDIFFKEKMIPNEPLKLNS